MNPERTPRLAIRHPRAAQVGVQATRQVLCPPPTLRVIREPPEREDREVARGDDVHLISRPPELDERRVLPAGRPGSLDPRMDR